MVNKYQRIMDYLKKNLYKNEMQELNGFITIERKEAQKEQLKELINIGAIAQMDEERVRKKFNL